MSDIGLHAEISVAMSRAGGLAVAAFFARPSPTSSEDWEAELAGAVFRAMAKASADEADVLVLDCSVPRYGPLPDGWDKPVSEIPASGRLNLFARASLAEAT